LTLSLISDERQPLTEPLLQATGILGSWFLIYTFAELARVFVLGAYQILALPIENPTLQNIRLYYFRQIILLVSFDILISIILAITALKSRNWGKALNDSLVTKTGTPLIIHSIFRILGDVYILSVINPLVDALLLKTIDPNYELPNEMEYIINTSRLFDLATLIFGFIAFCFLGYILIFVSEHYKAFRPIKLSGILLLLGAFLLLTEFGGIIIVLGAFLAGRRMRKICIVEKRKPSLSIYPYT